MTWGGPTERAWPQALWSHVNLTPSELEQTLCGEFDCTPGLRHAFADKVPCIYHILIPAYALSYPFIVLVCRLTP